MSVHILHHLLCGIVIWLVFDLFSPVIEEHCVLVALTDVALVVRRNLPSRNVVTSEQIEFLMAKIAYQKELIVDFSTSTNPTKLCSLQLHLIAFEISQFIPILFNVDLLFCVCCGSLYSLSTLILFVLIFSLLHFILNINLCLSCAVSYPKCFKQLSLTILRNLILMQMNGL